MTRKIRHVAWIALAGLVLVAATGDLAIADARADLTGTWTVTIATGQGDFDTNWELEQHDDGTLSGTIEGRQGSAMAEDGWVEDDRFGFGVTRDFNGQSFEIEYEGTFTDDALEGTLTGGGGQFTADFTGVRAEAEGDDR